MGKLLKLEEVVEAFDNIVKADPTFTYPQQEDNDPRCKCVEIYDEYDEDLPRYDFSDCPWHFNDDNICLYVKDGTSTAPACVVGHYFLELGIKDLHTWETKAPVAVLVGNGYEADAPAARFLNLIQSSQDQGYSWGEAFDAARESATRLSE